MVLSFHCFEQLFCFWMYFASSPLFTEFISRFFFLFYIKKKATNNHESMSFANCSRLYVAFTVGFSIHEGSTGLGSNGGSGAGHLRDAWGAVLERGGFHVADRFLK